MMPEPKNPYISPVLIVVVSLASVYWMILAWFDFKGQGETWAHGAAVFAFFAAMMFALRYYVPTRWY